MYPELSAWIELLLSWQQRLLLHRHNITLAGLQELANTYLKIGTLNLSCNNFAYVVDDDDGDDGTTRDLAAGRERERDLTTMI